LAQSHGFLWGQSLTLANSGLALTFTTSLNGQSESGSELPDHFHKLVQDEASRGMYVQEIFTDAL